MSDDDPWTGARAATRDEVRAVFSRGVRRCPACGAEQETSGRICPACGADTTARHAKPSKWRRIGLVALVVAIVAAAAYPLVNAMRDDAAVTRADAERRQAALEAAERKRLIAEARPVRAEGPPGDRPALVAAAEERITADAQARAAAGRLDGDVEGTECFPYPRTADRRAAETDAATVRARYDCVAYTSKFDAPEAQGQERTGLFGFPYWLVAEYDTGALVWCKVTPRAGEGGASLVAVPVPAPCRDPQGPG